MILLIAILLFMSPFALAQTASNAGFSGGGSATNGQVQLDMQSISSLENVPSSSPMDSDLPKAISQAKNTASGTSISLNSNTNTNVNLYPALIEYAYRGDNNANSDGKAITGTLQNNDQSYSNTSGLRQYSIGHTQFIGNGTGLSMNSNGGASLFKGEYTTRSPYTTSCYLAINCNYPCYADQYCSCICSYTEYTVTPPSYTNPTYPPPPPPPPVTAIPFMELEGGSKKVAPHSGNRQRKPAQAAVQKPRKTAGSQGRTRKEEQKTPPAQSRTQGKPQPKPAQPRARAVKPARQPLRHRPGPDSRKL